MLGKSLMREVRAQGIIIHERVVPAAVRAESGRKTLVAEDGREFRRLRLRAVGDRPRGQCGGTRFGQSGGCAR